MDSDSPSVYTTLRDILKSLLRRKHFESQKDETSQLMTEFVDIVLSVDIDSNLTNTPSWTNTFLTQRSFLYPHRKLQSMELPNWFSTITEAANWHKTNAWLSSQLSRFLTDANSWLNERSQLLNNMPLSNTQRLDIQAKVKDNIDKIIGSKTNLRTQMPLQEININALNAHTNTSSTTRHESESTASTPTLPRTPDIVDQGKVTITGYQNHKMLTPDMNRKPTSVSRRQPLRASLAAAPTRIPMKERRSPSRDSCHTISYL
jgi:hypothetical protein